MEHKVTNELPPIPAEHMAPNLPLSPEQQMPDTMTEKQNQQAIEVGAPQPIDPTYQPQVPPAAVPQPSIQQDQPIIADPQAPIIADDSDLIEKEWVLKAKEIVARTKHDPFQQNKEVERIKADYMKKRYNKDVKVTED